LLSRSARVRIPPPAPSNTSYSFDLGSRDRKGVGPVLNDRLHCCRASSWNWSDQLCGPPCERRVSSYTWRRPSGTERPPGDRHSRLLLVVIRRSAEGHAIGPIRDVPSAGGRVETREQAWVGGECHLACLAGLKLHAFESQQTHA